MNDNTASRKRVAQRLLGIFVQRDDLDIDALVFDGGRNDRKQNFGPCRLKVIDNVEDFHDKRFFPHAPRECITTAHSKVRTRLKNPAPSGGDSSLPME
jgi:hypothetical protein